MSTTAYEPTDRTRLRLRPDRGSYDRALVHAIIDEAIVCHVGCIVVGEPCVLPTTIVRIDEDVYLHGSTANRVLRALADGARACITITHIDAVVAGRSGFGCSVDYRSVVCYATGEVVADDATKEHVLAAVIQSVIRGHVVRRPTAEELKATIVLRFPLVEVSAKVRDCGVREMERDLALDTWAGVVPLRVTAGPARSADHVRSDMPIPDYATNYRR